MGKIIRNKPIAVAASKPAPDRSGIQKQGRIRGRTISPWVKVGGAVLAAAALMGIAYRFYSGNRDPVIDTNQLLSYHMYPGYQLVGDGSQSCLLKERISKIQSHTECVSSVKEMIKLITDTGQIDRIFNKEAARFKGTPLGFTADYTHSLGLDSNKLKDHIAAVSYTNKEILKNPNFFNRTTDEIIGVIQHVHSLIAGHESNTIRPGEFRERCMWVRKHQHDTTDQQLINRFLANGGSSEDIPLLRNSPFDYCDFTDAQKAAWSLIGYFPPHWKEVPGLLKNLVNDLKAAVGLAKDPISIASDLHMGLVKIHPFNDANGRVARLFMNVILRWFGLDPVVFPSDEAYTEAVSSGRFEEFLRHTIIPWTKQAQNILMR